MGDYSLLSIGRVGFAWKYEVPAFLTFLFADEDFHSELNEAPEDGNDSDGWVEYEGWVGYRTSAVAARRRLNDLGFTFGFFGGILEMLASEIDEALIHSLMERGWRAIAQSERFSEHDSRVREEAVHLVRETAARPAADQIAAFAEGLRSAVSGESTPAYVKSLRSRFARDGVDLLLDPYELAYQLNNSEEPVEPSVLRVAQLLAEGSECPREVSDLLLARVLVEIVPESAEVRLDLTDFYEGDDLRGKPSRLGEELVRRVQIYNHTFNVLLKNQDDLRRRTLIIQVDQMLRALPTATTNDEKGRLLEDLVATIFDVPPRFIVAQRRYDLGDQEIDLVIRNHVDDPFWTALQTPVILVECKNWSAPVGATHLRDFETKLRDHGQARLGIFVAINGFSGEIDSVLKRAGRERYQLLPLTRRHLMTLVDEGLDVVEWLTREISALT